jgi:hypothetical protein
MKETDILGIFAKFKVKNVKKDPELLKKENIASLIVNLL